MDAGQLDAFLTSQKRKREGAMTEDQAKVYARFWKNHRSRIHEALVARTLWSPSLVDLSWRIDIKTQSRQSDRLSCPTAILELQLKDPLHKEQVKPWDNKLFSLCSPQLTVSKIRMLFCRTFGSAGCQILVDARKTCWTSLCSFQRPSRNFGGHADQQMGVFVSLTKILFVQGPEDRHYFEGWVKGVFAMELWLLFCLLKVFCRKFICKDTYCNND